MDDFQVLTGKKMPIPSIAEAQLNLLHRLACYRDNVGSEIDLTTLHG
jgi:hypothetical protein